MVRIVDSIAAIAPAAWNACAGADNPFVSHAFLLALEASGSVTAEEGWLPQHLVVEGEAGRIDGIAPLYLKGHSYGEYVFDWAWAGAYERAGGRYYPKLQCCVPFTPVTGPRLLVHPAAEHERVASLLLRGMLELARAHDVSSLHLTFVTEAEQRLCVELGLLPRRGIQYHFRNEGYRSFDEFLAALSSRKRKAIRKERDQAREPALVALGGAALEARHWDAFHRFYVDTIDRKHAQAYLTRDFFRRLGTTMPEQVVMMTAEQDGRPVAAALNLRGRDALYGRYWGSEPAFGHLHFEACYYRAIDYAIEHGLARIEAGAQGPHKIQRGYLPVYTYSAHWLADAGFRQVIADYLQRERRALENELRALEEHSPFRKTERRDGR